MIKLFGEKAGSIWGNVIIIAKEGKEGKQRQNFQVNQNYGMNGATCLPTPVSVSESLSE